MGLADVISKTHKEIAGSRSKNRLTVQISYAIQLIMEFYSMDFLIMMDYIEDVSVICESSSHSEIHLYQVKTKSSDKQYLLSTIIHDKWYQKLYANALKYTAYLRSASVTCNTDIVNAQDEVFHNAKTLLTDKAIEANIDKIKKAIAKDQKITIEDVDLSKFYFIRSRLSTKGHKEEVEHQFQDFLLTKEPDLQVAVAKSIYKLLYDELDSKFNNEIDEDCTDTQEIYSQKGVPSSYIKDMIACGLAVQLPTLEKLFAEYNISSVSERRKYISTYSRIKMDMYSNMTTFVNLKKSILESVEAVNQSGIDTMEDILDETLKLLQDKTVPDAYNEELYKKLLSMILIFKYCYGGALL